VSMSSAGVATGQASKVNRLAVDAAAQKCGVQVCCQIKPVRRVGMRWRSVGQEGTV
jgi:hypothetical protein